MTDDELERMIQEARAAGPMGLEEFERETEAIRAYARQAWQAGLASGSAGRLDMGEVKRQGRMGRALRGC